jgi:hypothetical protein
VTPAATILDACGDPALFARWFRDRATWGAWFAFLRALFGLPMTAADLDLFRRCTGRAEPPDGGAREAWLVCGRRAGKSFVLALVAVFLATFINWLPFLAPGDRGTVMVIATDRRQARTIFRYARALLSQVPLLAAMVERETSDAIDLTNGITIEILTANFRTVRGYTLVAALCDELAFWRSEDSANPDVEIISAIRPAMATVPGSMLLCASSPYARRGALWEAYRRHFGQPSPVLVWKADTRTMNPTVPQAVIDEATETDPANAAAEYGGEFRGDIESFVSREAIDAAVVPGRFELAPLMGVAYVAFVDPSGGSSDAMTLAIAHGDKDGRAILDAVRERRPPFSPDAVVAEFAMPLKSYNVVSVQGDRYAGEWPRERFSVHGIRYESSETPKSDLYRDALPMLNSGRVELLDHPRLVAQLAGLERRTARSGKDSIDHAPGGHDDVANAVVGALLAAQDCSSLTLWGRSCFGAPVAMPTRADMLYATIVVSPDGQTGVAYFGWIRLGSPPLILLDCDLGPLSPMLLEGVVARLSALAETVRASGVVVFTTAPIAAELQRLGHHRGIEAIDEIVGDELLTLACAVHITAGRVRVCADVLAKNHPLVFLHGRSRQPDNDPQSTAVLAGIAIALDENRSLGRAA